MKDEKRNEAQSAEHGWAARFGGPVAAALLLVIVVGATALRTYELGDLPAGFFCDEAAFGYNAWAIGSTGYDENGKFLPLFVWSFSGYKNPVYIYADALIVRLFGLSEFTTRLPAAVFGVASIVALFFCGRAMFNSTVGLFAALFLTLAPWHLQFSRVAFEQTAFAMLFTAAVALLIRFTQGERVLGRSFFLFALCPYAYAISTVTAPLFLLGFAVLYLPTLVRRWRETLWATLVAIATVAPCGLFYWMNPRGSGYLQRTTWLDSAKPFADQWPTYQRYYLEFFNPVFLFQRGDEIARHAVHEFGELHPAYLPLLLLGAVAALLHRGRAGKLALWWLIVYPVAPSIMTEIPTASRAFIGAPGFCLLAGIGAGTALWILRVLRWRPLVLAAQTAAVGALAYFLAPQVYRYVTFYWNEYPKYSAPTYGGFQYGYRDSIRFMEELRPKYGRPMLTATLVNQPQIFPLFYNRVDPRQYARNRDMGYGLADPMFYGEYAMDRKLLYQLRRSDVFYFEDYTELKSIVAPGGQEEFVIAEVRRRKNFFREWLGLGPFDNGGNAGARRDFVDVHGLTGAAAADWQPMHTQTVRVQLRSARGSNAAPVASAAQCAYAATTIVAEKAQSAFLEMSGSDDTVSVWLNGEDLTGFPLTLGAARVHRPVQVRQGRNLIVVKGCDLRSEWYFTARLTDAAGHDIPGITVDPSLAGNAAGSPPAPGPESSDVQFVEGFHDIVGFAHTDPYDDYRGRTVSWWTYASDANKPLVWHTAPVPAKRRTALVVTVSMSTEPFAGTLQVGDRDVLRFTTRPEAPIVRWAEGDYALTWIRRANASGESGVAVIEVPAEAVTAGEPLELRVRASPMPNPTWFMVKGYPDTAAFEGFGAAQVAAFARSAWQVVAGN